MSGIGLAVRQVKFENRAFWRNPAAAFFTFAFPLVFMVIFSVLFGREAGTFFTPGIITFSVVSATYTNIAMSVTIARDEGILKRIRGTPLPPRAYLAGRILHAVAIGLLLTIIVVGFGAVVMDVPVPWSGLPTFVIVLTVGSASFCALGLAISGLVPNAEAAPAVVNASILPLFFFSNVFVPMEGVPAWLDTLSRIFPVRHLADAVASVYASAPSVPPMPWTELGVIVAWGIGAALFALRFFRWEPRA